MRQYRTVMREVQEVRYITCNQCGKQIEMKDGTFGDGQMASMDIEWGFGSRKDLEQHKIDICEECYDRWIASFKVPVTVEPVTLIL